MVGMPTPLLGGYIIVLGRLLSKSSIVFLSLPDFLWVKFTWCGDQSKQNCSNFKKQI